MDCIILKIKESQKILNYFLIILCPIILCTTLPFTMHQLTPQLFVYFFTIQLFCLLYSPLKAWCINGDSVSHGCPQKCNSHNAQKLQHNQLNFFKFYLVSSKALSFLYWYFTHQHHCSKFFAWIFTPNNFKDCVWHKALEKCFKFFHIFAITILKIEIFFLGSLFQKFDKFWSFSSSTKFEIIWYNLLSMTACI